MQTNSVENELSSENSKNKYRRNCYVYLSRSVASCCACLTVLAKRLQTCMENVAV